MEELEAVDVVDVAEGGVTFSLIFCACVCIVCPALELMVRLSDVSTTKLSLRRSTVEIGREAELKEGADTGTPTLATGFRDVDGDDDGREPFGR